VTTASPKLARKLRSIEAAAAYLAVSTKTIRRYIALGKLPAIASARPSSTSTRPTLTRSSARSPPPARGAAEPVRPQDGTRPTAKKDRVPPAPCKGASP